MWKLYINTIIIIISLKFYKWNTRDIFIVFFPPLVKWNENYILYSKIITQKFVLVILYLTGNHSLIINKNTY